MREWKKNHPDYVKKQTAEYREKNRQLLRDKASQYHQQNFSKHRAYELLRNYGITIAQYNVMYWEQHGKCYICGRECPSGGRKGLHVDHDHNTGKVRRLLCHGCNMALGGMNDDIILSEKITAYLKQFRGD